jgi:hypothetical protein
MCSRKAIAARATAWRCFALYLINTQFSEIRKGNLFVVRPGRDPLFKFRNSDLIEIAIS